MFPVAAELKDELRTRMLQARTREGTDPLDMRESTQLLTREGAEPLDMRESTQVLTHLRGAATPLDPGLALLGPREGRALPAEAALPATEAALRALPAPAALPATPNTNPYLVLLAPLRALAAMFSYSLAKPLPDATSGRYLVEPAIPKPPDNRRARDPEAPRYFVAPPAAPRARSPVAMLRAAEDAEACALPTAAANPYIVSFGTALRAPEARPGRGAGAQHGNAYMVRALGSSSSVRFNGVANPGTTVDGGVRPVYRQPGGGQLRRDGAELTHAVSPYAPRRDTIRWGSAHV